MRSLYKGKTMSVTFGRHCSIFGHFWKTSNKYDLVVSSERRFFFKKDRNDLNLFHSHTSNIVLTLIKGNKGHETVSVDSTVYGNRKKV